MVLGGGVLVVAESDTLVGGLDRVEHVEPNPCTVHRRSRSTAAAAMEFRLTIVVNYH